MKKVKYLIFSLILLVPVISLNAQTIKEEDVPNSTYVIGTHMFTRDINEETGYEGKLTTQLIMLASKTLEGNNIEDMVILYKNPRGVWINAMSTEEVSVASTFEITNKNKEVVDNIIFGDVNNDGLVNSMDRTYLGRYLDGWEDYDLTANQLRNADVNVDGYINIIDYAILSRYIAEWKGYDALPYNGKVTPELYGDVNEDGEVTEADSSYLTRYLSKWEGYELSAEGLLNADVNSDGKVNNKDSLILDRHIEGWEGYETLPYKEIENMINYGDVDENGEVNISDVTTLRRYLQGLISLNKINVSNSDVNGDGGVNEIDAQLLQQYLAGSYQTYNLPKEPLKGNVYRIEFSDLDEVVFGLEGYKPASKGISKDGYTFIGWYEDGAEEAYDFEQPITRNVTLYARFQEN